MNENEKINEYISKYNDNNNNNNIKDAFDKTNVSDNNLTVNETLLDEKFFDNLYLLVLEKGISKFDLYHIPNSLEYLDKDILKEIVEIDNLYIYGIITREKAFDMMLELLVSYNEYCAELNDIDIHIRSINNSILQWIKKLKKGEITKEEFEKAYGELHSIRLRLIRQARELNNSHGMGSR